MFCVVQSSRQHITDDVLDSFLSLTRYLVELPAGGQLLKHLFDHILFNPSLWIYSSVDVSVAFTLFFFTSLFCRQFPHNRGSTMKGPCLTLYVPPFESLNLPSCEV